MNNGECTKKNEVVVCNTLFKYDLVPAGENAFDLVCTPCNTPTAVYNIGRISQRENSCNQIEYYQAFINCDPVQIIQDCDLQSCISRAIAIYFECIPTISCQSCGCSGLGFGLF